MPLRQEAKHPQNYTSPGTDRIAPKFRTGADWEKFPDYDKLPDFALIDAAEVSLITGMSPAVLKRRIEEGQFASPNYHGRNRVWSLGYVRGWCRKLGQTLEPGEAA